jgi:predicted ATP-dependent serine protease
MSYFLDAEARFDEYNRACAKLMFNIKMIDEWTDGGYDAEGTLNLIMAISGGGKSIWLVNIAASALLQGKNVLYVTMELAESKIHQRIDAKLFDIEVSDIKNLDRDAYLSKVNQIQAKSHGDIVVKQLPTGAASVLDIRHVLSELKLKKNWQPDVIISDYLGIMSSSKKSKNDNTYTSQKAIAEELRALGIEFRIPIWSAVQYNRSGYGNSAGGLDSISDSMGVVFTADLVLSLFQNDELAEMNSVMVKSLKNRYGLVDVTTIIGLNKGRMSFYDVDDTNAGHLVSKYRDDMPPVVTDEPKLNNFKSRRTFDDLLLED